MRFPMVAVRPPPSKVCHRLAGAYYSPDGTVRYSKCGAVLDCPEYRSREMLLPQAERLGRHLCTRPDCHWKDTRHAST